jgi:glycosyltransferase involved in cell wall biosynthesis
MYSANLIVGFIGCFLKIKNIVWSVHGSVHLPSTKISTFIIILMCSFLSWIIPNYIVFVSKYSIKRHLKLGFCKNKIRLITNGFTVKDEGNIYRNREFLEREFSILRDFKIFAMISRYHPVKDFKTLLLSLKILKENFKNFKCLLIGHNIYQNKELEFLVNRYQLNNNVLLVGEIRDITSLISGFDLLFLSSLSESFPNVIIEAMANGTPCISTNVGDISLIIDDETGWVIPKSNPQAFSQSILLAINEMDNKFLWNERRLKCIRKIKNNYSFEKMNNKYVELWENI